MIKNLTFSALLIPIASAAEQQVPIAEQVANFYQWALAISGLVALGIIVYAGLAYTASGGNPSRQADAKQWIWNALVGLALLFGSYLILNTVNPNLTKLQNIDLTQVKFERVTEAPAAKNLNLPELIGSFYQWALGIGGIIALGIIIFAGILYTVSPGNASRQGEAKTWIMSALLGLVLLFGSYAILNTVNPDLTKLRFNLDEVQFAKPTGEPAAPGEPPKPGEKVPLGIAEQIGNFYQWALGIGGLVALGVLIFGGILYIISAGNASRQDDAKNWLFGAVMGIFLLFGSYLILNTINPELTKLKDISLLVNPKAEDIPLGSIFVGGVVGNYGSCGGLYPPFSILRGNFADPKCEAPAPSSIGSASFIASPKFKNDLLALLQQLDPVNANHWFYKVVPRETAGTYNPNIVNPNSTCVQERTCTLGACGLFQMRCECPAPDCGAVHWREQIANAVNLLRQGRANYWPCRWYTTC